MFECVCFPRWNRVWCGCKRGHVNGAIDATQVMKILKFTVPAGVWTVPWQGQMYYFISRIYCLPKRDHGRIRMDRWNENIDFRMLHRSSPFGHDAEFTFEFPILTLVPKDERRKTWLTPVKWQTIDTRAHTKCYLHFCQCMGAFTLVSAVAVAATASRWLMKSMSESMCVSAQPLAIPTLSQPSSHTPSVMIVRFCLSIIGHLRLPSIYHCVVWCERNAMYHVWKWPGGFGVPRSDRNEKQNRRTKTTHTHTRTHI